MSAVDEVSRLKSAVEELKLERARMSERLQSLRDEKERLLNEAQQLGLDDPLRLDEWVAEKRQAFDTAKEQLESAVAAAQGTGATNARNH